ncbi:MAG: rod shape-determining protein MreD [Magnetospirillum sp. WYHS-4]
MKRSLWHRLDALARHLTPFALTLFLLVVELAPLHVPGLAEMAPLLPVAAIYHWTIYRPDLMPAAAVFLLGLLHDALTGLPFGSSTLVFLMVYGAVLSQRRFFIGKSFVIHWLGFAMVGAGAVFFLWLTVSALNGGFVQGRAGLFQYLATLGAFPLLSWLFLGWQQAVLRND